MSATVEVRSIHTGDLFLNNKLLFADTPPENENDTVLIPIEAFYIYHPEKKIHALWDLGIRKDFENSPPAAAKAMEELFKPTVEEDVEGALTRNGVDPAKIDYVFFSHVHFDHTGDIEKFPNAKLVWGQGTQGKAKPGYPIDKESWYLSSLFPEDRTRELVDEDFTGSVGPFPRACDFFGDGSVLLVDAPGHVPGHQVAIVKTKEGQLLLGGDSCHHCTHLETFDTGKMSYKMHEDEELAKKNIKHIKTWLKDGEKRKLAMAHFGNYKDFGIVDASVV